jgi:hypothetical protein
VSRRKRCFPPERRTPKPAPFLSRSQTRTNLGRTDRESCRHLSLPEEIEGGSVPPSRLTQQHRREAKGRPPFCFRRRAKARQHLSGCGKQLQRGRRFCSKCAANATRESFDAGLKRARGASRKTGVHHGAAQARYPELESWGRTRLAHTRILQETDSTRTCQRCEVGNPFGPAREPHVLRFRRSV